MVLDICLAFDPDVCSSLEKHSTHFAPRVHVQSVLPAPPDWISFVGFSFSMCPLDIRIFVFHFPEFHSRPTSLFILQGPPPAPDSLIHFHVLKQPLLMMMAPTSIFSRSKFSNSLVTHSEAKCLLDILIGMSSGTSNSACSKSTHYLPNLPNLIFYYSPC